ncbi:hypothetical protein SAMN05421863_103424 [Nitrosomonas communis]|uniref:Uncharacterized protein n=1 Tax=Nitrosomonas communis TaxID=44574 RepID=A0A1I4RP97_9PROT|nr:hypothetical protein SAMN05421863_103424 [Nitrosomonas communis]
MVLVFSASQQTHDTGVKHNLLSRGCEISKGIAFAINCNIKILMKQGENPYSINFIAIDCKSLAERIASLLS